MKDYKIEITTTISDESKKSFEESWRDHQVVGLMTESGDGPSITRVILKMKPGHKGWTPYGTARDCGDHYIVARYSRFDRIDKKTLEVTKDVDDR